jgi:hypothetical protein
MTDQPEPAERSPEEEAQTRADIMRCTDSMNAIASAYSAQVVISSLLSAIIGGALQLPWARPAILENLRLVIGQIERMGDLPPAEANAASRIPGMTFDTPEETSLPSGATLQ